MTEKSKKSDRLWWPKYIGDYSRKTRHLSMAGHGAFNLLLDHYYQSEAPLPLEWVQLHRICSAVAPEEQAIVQAVVNEFFRQTPDGWVNDRADQEIFKKRDISDKRRAAQTERERQRLEREHLGHFKPGSRKGKYKEVPPAEVGALDPANDGAKDSANGVHLHPQPQLQPHNINPLTPFDARKVAKFDIEEFLTADDRREAKAQSPYKDLQTTILLFNAHIRTGKMQEPDYPAKAFIDFVIEQEKTKKAGNG